MTSPVTSLEAARRRKGFSREHVARELRISAKTVERHERRRTPVKLFQLERYAALYAVEPASLLDMLEVEAVA